MLQQRAFTLAGAVAAGGQQQQLLPCWLASLKCITEALQAALSQSSQQYTQQQQNAHAARPPGVLPLPVQHASSEGTQLQMQLQLHASAAMRHLQWPSLHSPAAATPWCGSPIHQARNTSSSSSSSYHARTQQLRGMHSAASDLEGHKIPAETTPAGSSSSSTNSKHSADANQQQQQVSTTFKDMGLPDAILQALQEQGFAAPTPVQVAAQQAVLSGRNVALQSATGTGKTLAYLLPLLSQLQPWLHGKEVRGSHGRVLVICPTQELCMQVLRAARSLLPANRHRVQPLVGGASPLRQLMAFKEHKPSIVVATPGRLLKVIHKGGAFTNAFPWAARCSNHSKYKMVLVLEEADKLLAMSDTVQVLRLLAAWLHEDRHEIAAHAKAFKAAKGLARKDRFTRVPDVDSEQYEEQQQKTEDCNFMQTVLNEYQVLLVSAGLKPSTLARAPAWAATRPVMIAAPPPAAPVALPPLTSSTLSSSSSSSKESSKELSSSSSSQDAALDASSSSSEEQERERLRLLEMGLLREGKGFVAKGPKKGEELGGRVERALMLPEHIKHQFLLYPRNGDMQKYLLRCLNSYLEQGCKALVFVGQRQNVWALHLELQHSGKLKAEMGCLHSAVEPQEKAALLRRFNSGQLRALLLTDAYGLGLDFKDVDVVLGVESLPAGVQQYIRRAGRTGRMGRPGAVLNIIPDQRRDALHRTLKRLFIVPQEMALKQKGISDGGGWTVEPKLTAEAILAGSKPSSEPQQQQQQRQQRSQPRQAGEQRGFQEQQRSWPDRSSSSNRSGGGRDRLRKPRAPLWQPYRPF